MWKRIEADGSIGSGANGREEQRMLFGWGIEW